ncbi:hypothetical protein SAMN02744040_01216 [Tepidibacter thalassicus DSM 15285]|uniref:DUF8042 domain-containing protein n=2 Tax=Tepidibacter TaxID=214904 RepID=A0A1M5R2R2_9FIRM|nr:hypothetical protein SAMN02744040_01216 [Tepidibacter thalassicus DSM 15285]
MNNQKLEILKTIDEYLEKLIYDIKDTIEFFQNGNEGKGNEMVVEVIQALNDIIEGINITSDIQKEKIEISKINEYLMEMVYALENRDYVLIADLLEYEIIPVLENWKDKVLVTIGA